MTGLIGKLRWGGTWELGFWSGWYFSGSYNINKISHYYYT